MQCGGFVFADLVLVGGGFSHQVGTGHVDHDLKGGGASTLCIGDGNGELLRLLDGYSLRGLCVGVDHHIGRLPMVGEVAWGGNVDAKCGGAAIHHRTWRGGHQGFGEGEDRNGLGDFV